MRPFLLILVLLISSPLISQTGDKKKPIYTAEEGKIRVEATDVAGAEVMVEYDYDLTKTYQERTIDGVTMFARFYEGNVIEYGMVYQETFEFGGNNAERIYSSLRGH